MGFLRDLAGAVAPRLSSRLIINKYAAAAPPRPRPLTMVGDAPSWRSLTERRFSGRHLPPHDAPSLPPMDEVVDLFRRESFRPAGQTSVLFAFFAQWFTDSFLRTDARDRRLNTSNHEIDLCQIYGLRPHHTRMLRVPLFDDTSHPDRGCLRHQFLDGEEFPEFLLERGPDGAHRFREAFRKDPRPDLDGDPSDPLFPEDFFLGAILRNASDDAKDRVFAVGLEHGNSTIGATLMNVIFLREHNRIARMLADDHKGWSGDRVFETTRNIMIAILLKIVIEDYIRHIAGDFPLKLPIGIADKARWNRSNWIAVEFNLLYRWHMLVPDEVPPSLGEAAIGAGEMRNNNRLVIERGTDALAAQLSRAPAGAIGLRNTPGFLFQSRWPGELSTEARSVDLSRFARLAPYNDYRRHFGLNASHDFDRLTRDAAMRADLRALYGSVDRVEWYVGIFAESYARPSIMGELLTTMVAYDAFTQALTNPLLNSRVFDAEDTMTLAGRHLVRTTSRLRQLIGRHRGREDAEASFDILR